MLCIQHYIYDVKNINIEGNLYTSDNGLYLLRDS
jgi:hypothetical protein